MRRLAILLALLTIVTATVAPARIEDSPWQQPAEPAVPRILATGDSMMRGVDRDLRDQLSRIQAVSLRSDLHIGDGITNAPWARIGRWQVRKHQATVTVVFMGANDGYDMRGARCCHRAWVAKYERRVRRLIRIHLRHGGAEVYWLTLPAAESARRRQIFPKINRAIRRAVHAAGSHAHVVDAAAALTPGGRYRRFMLWHGKRVRVRHPDGIHLQSAGPAIVADLITRAMLRDGVVTRRDSVR